MFHALNHRSKQPSDSSRVTVPFLSSSNSAMNIGASGIKFFELVFPIWTPLGYAPSDNSSILTKRYVESQ